MSEINLSKLPPPEIVQQKSAETILAERLATLKGMGVDIDNFTASDPIYRNQLAASYREALIRQDANEQSLGNMLAFAKGAELDHIAATYYHVERLPGEQDEPFKERIQLSPEGSSVAGPEGKYLFEARSTSALVKDASFFSPQPIHGEVTILSTEGDGTPSQALIDAVALHLMDDGVRPQTDVIAVVAPTILNYSITAQLVIGDGPDTSEVLSQATKELQDYVNRQHKLGGQVVLAGVYGALMVEGVTDIILDNFSEVRASKTEAPYCTELLIT
jgi:phage-related baseplate assembly protein